MSGDNDEMMPEVFDAANYALIIAVSYEGVMTYISDQEDVKVAEMLDHIAADLRNGTAGEANFGYRGGAL